MQSLNCIEDLLHNVKWYKGCSAKSGLTFIIHFGGNNWRTIGTRGLNVWKEISHKRIRKFRIKHLYYNISERESIQKFFCSYVTTLMCSHLYMIYSY
jgi:hypothetical protein